MKKTILFSLLIYSNLNANVVDFGVSGHEYRIPEENLMRTIESEVEAFQKKLSKDKLQGIIKEEIKTQSIGYSNLPTVTRVSAYEVDNYQIIDQDIKNPAGRIWKRKGEKVLMNTIQPLDLCFVDGSNMLTLLNQIEYFDAVAKQKSNSECTYMISGRSVLFLNNKLAPRVFYPAKKAYEDRFLVKSLPTYIHIEGTKKLVYSFPISMFKHKVKIKRGDEK